MQKCVITGDLVVANAALGVLQPPGSRPDGARALDLEARATGLVGGQRNYGSKARNVFVLVQPKVFLTCTCKLHQHVKHIDLT